MDAAISYATGIWRYLTCGEEEQRRKGKQDIKKKKKSVCSVCYMPSSYVLPKLPELPPLMPGFA